MIGHSDDGNTRPNQTYWDMPTVEGGRPGGAGIYLDVPCRQRRLLLAKDRTHTNAVCI